MVCVSPEITADLRDGMSLEDCLIKHGTNLQELFCSKPGFKVGVVTESTWIVKTGYGKYRIQKQMNKKRYSFGTYRSHEDALLVRDELIKCGWDKRKLPEILEHTGVVRETVGGYHR